MDKSVLHSNLQLLLAAIIWGFAFVAQREGMEYIGPFLFNALRFAAGVIVLFPFLIKSVKSENKSQIPYTEKRFYIYGFLAGLLLYFGSAAQQAGLVFTTAGKAGFITGLYMVFVPVFGLFIRQRTSLASWTGIVIAIIGLYLLSFTKNFSIQYGDLLELISAIVWAIQVLFIGKISPRINPVQLAIFQFFVCSILNLITVLFVETISISQIKAAGMSLIYAGFISVGIGYTLQVVAQRKTLPSHAAIIMSLESVFALIGGWLLLNEIISIKEFIGCLLMFTGMIVSQSEILIDYFRKRFSK